MQIFQTNFRAYDIRGQFPEEINEESAEVIAKALGTIFQEKNITKIIVGRDNRVNSENVATAIIKGLLSTGCDVNYTGITSQPAMHYFSFLGFDASVNITASHNPEKYTGIKIDYADAKPFYDEDLQYLYKRAVEGNFKVGKGNFTQLGLNNQYIALASGKLRLQNKIKVALNCGGAATSEIAKHVMNEINAYTNCFFCDLGDNIRHKIPDPDTPEFINELQEQTLSSNSDIGIGFDGDGDRIAVIDELGNVFKADDLLILLSKYILKEHPGSTVIYDVKCSQRVDKEIKKFGGIPIMMRTGRAYFLNEMLPKKAIVGAEYSGHVYLGDRYYGFDDAIYTACRVLEIMDKEEKKLSELMSEFPPLSSTPEIKVMCPDDKKFGLIADLQNIVKPDGKNFVEVSTIDGIRVKTSDTGWFLIRASNTSPYLSVRFEGIDDREISRDMQVVSDLLSKYPYADISVLAKGRR